MRRLLRPLAWLERCAASIPVRALIATHGLLTLGFLVMTPVGALTGLRNSVPYLVAISNLALALAEFGAWQAARAEREAIDAEQVAGIVRCEVERASTEIRARFDETLAEIRAYLEGAAAGEIEASKPVDG